MKAKNLADRLRCIIAAQDWTGPIALDEAEHLAADLLDALLGDHSMPVFVIKAQDALAIEAVTEYRDLCMKYGLQDQADQVQLAIGELADWQAANPERVKMPDHQHVPVGGADRAASTPNQDPDGAAAT